MLDMFRFEISLIQTNEDKHTVRNMRLELEEKNWARDADIFRKHQTKDGFESKKMDKMFKESVCK